MTEQRHLIWSNYDLDYEDWRDDLEEDHPELTEDERMALMYEINNRYLDDERVNLNIWVRAANNTPVCVRTKMKRKK